MAKRKKAKQKMPPWLVTILYFGCIALIIGGLYGIYSLTGGKDETKKEETVKIQNMDGSVTEVPKDEAQEVTVENPDGSKNKTIVSGEDAFDKDGYFLDSNGERVKDADGNYMNQLARWAEALLGAEVDANDFGVDEEGYCYRPSTGERYKTSDGKEFTDMDAYNGSVSDKTEAKNE